MAYPFQETDAPADVAASDATPAPSRKRYSLKGYSFLDAASRAHHPIVSALVANALAGPQAYKLLDALNQREEARKRSMAAASEKRFEVGRNLALKMGDVAPLEPDDPLRPQFERAFGTMSAAPPPEGYEKKPPGNFLRKPAPIKPPPHRPVAGEGGIFDVGPGEGGGLEARPIPVLPPVGTPTAEQGAPGASVKPIPPPMPPPTPPVAPTKGAKPRLPGMVPSHEPVGAGMFLKPKPPKAPGPGKPKMVQNESGFFEPIDPTTGNSLLTGKPVRGKGPANLAGIQAQIDSAGLALENMKASYERGAKAGLGSRTTGALAQGVSEKLPSLRGMVQEYAPSGEDATIHEQNRGVVAGMLVRPLFGSARGQYLAEKIEKAIPHFTDSRNVADNFYRQAQAFMASARRMPWDTSPKEAQRQYEAAAAGFLAAISQASGATSPAPAGTTGDPVEDLLGEYHRRRGATQR